MKLLSRTPRRVIACTAIALFGCTSCGDDDDPSSTAASAPTGETASTGSTASTEDTAPVTTEAELPASAEMCAAREALSSSVAALADVDLRAEGTNGVTAALDAVKGDLSTLQESLSAELQPQAQAVRDALDELEAAVADLGSGGAAASVTALSNLGTSAGTLLDSLSVGTCDSSAPSTT